MSIAVERFAACQKITLKILFLCLTNTPRGYYNIIIDHKRRSVMKEAIECCKKKTRSEGEKKKLVNRLKRIEGQVRGVLGMIESDSYCIDVLTQISAISSALSSFSKELLESHIRSCVQEDVRAGGTEKVDELVEVISRMVK